MPDVDLNGRVILGSDQSVGGRALPGNVKFRQLTFLVLHVGALLVETRTEDGNAMN